MKVFTTPQWESNPLGDKTHDLFKKSADQKPKKFNKKNKNPEIKDGRIKKAKSKKKLKKLENKIKNTTINNTHEKKLNSNDSFNKKHMLNRNNDKSESIKNRTLKNKKQNFNLKESFLNKKRTLKRNDKSESTKNSTPKNKKQKKKLKSRDLESAAQNVTVKPTKQTTYKDDDFDIKPKKPKNKVTHQTLFITSSRKARSKLLKNKASSEANVENVNINSNKKKKQRISNTDASNESSTIDLKSMSKKQKKIQKFKDGIRLVQKGPLFKTPSRKQIASLPLRERMLEKLKAGRFRYINEQMYTSLGKDAKKYFESDAGAYTAYHEGYKQQVARWPLNPLDVIIQKIENLPRTHIIADFGCGEAKLAKSVPHTVHSFDLVALDECVTACDMAHVPLENDSVNVVVFCLSLMGTNLKDYLIEANRVLKVGGLMKIAEVESRFDNVDTFVKDVQSFGFRKTGKDFSHDLFCFLDFVKKESNSKRKNKLPDVNLNPCLYKKR